MNSDINRIACVIGTRPEAVKMASVIVELSKRTNVETVVISTGQHRDMVNPFP
jgi:UDP-N-acetylglucosamine 2-epimerase (non-hydrolysing)